MHIISAVSMICLWQIFSKLVNSPLILPSFFRVLADFFSLLKTKIFYAALLSTFRRVMESFCMSLFLGSVLGFFYGRFEAVKNLLSFPLAVLRATPVIALILILVFSLSSSSVPVAASILMTLPLIITSIGEGTREALKNYKLNEMTKVFGFSKKQKFSYILIPSIKPHFKSSVISSFGMSWKVVAAGEVLSLPRFALGSELSKAQVHLETSQVLAYTLALILTSFLLESVLKILCREKKYVSHSKKPDPKSYMPKINENERLALIAPSGFGKTTLLDYVAKNFESVSYSFQENRLIEELSVYQNILIPLKNKFDEKTASEKSAYYIEETFLSEKKDVKIKNLSGGQKQRVALARALAFPSKVLLLDESFNAQDFDLKMHLMDFIKKDLRENPRTLIFVTHDERDGKYLCERTVHLDGNNAI